MDPASRIACRPLPSYVFPLYAGKEVPTREIGHPSDPVIVLFVKLGEQRDSYIPVPFAANVLSETVSDELFVRFSPYLALFRNWFPVTTEELFETINPSFSL